MEEVGGVVFLRISANHFDFFVQNDLSAVYSTVCSKALGRMYSTVYRRTYSTLQIYIFIDIALNAEKESVPQE